MLAPKAETPCAEATVRPFYDLYDRGGFVALALIMPELGMGWKVARLCAASAG